LNTAVTPTGLVPDTFIQEVLSRIDIVQIISERLRLKKTGANYSACCPFHQEKTPSFTVSPHKQFYHCFGCSAHGDAIAFLMQQDGLSFIEALTQLADSVGLVVPQDEQAKKQQAVFKPLFEYLAQAAQFYQYQLRHHPQANVAIDYLKQRGLTGQVAKQFGIGYAPPGWDNLLRHLGKDKASIEQLLTAGLVIDNQKGNIYDRFRHRIMFPIRDSKGRVIGFGGRVIQDTDTPKYLNSPETPVFHKSQCLYGLYEILHWRSAWTQAILVEGYMDVMALSQYHIEGALASLGTAVTVAHLQLIFRYCADVVFCFDGDEAGNKAAWKSLLTLLPLMEDGRAAKFVFLPAPYDPDGFLRHYGIAAFKKLLTAGLPLSDYLFQSLARQVPITSIDNQARYIKQAKALLQQLPAGSFKAMMYDKLANFVGVERSIVEGKISSTSQHGSRASRPARQPVEALRLRLLTPAYLASALLARHPSLIHSLSEPEALLQVQVEGMNLLSPMVELLIKDPHLNHEALKATLISKGFNWQAVETVLQSLTLIPHAGREDEFRGAIERLLISDRKARNQQLLEKARNGTLSAAEKDQLKKILTSNPTKSEKDI